MFKFISNQVLEDQYTKEAAVIELTLKDDSKIRVTYVRKETKDGRKFWGTMSIFAETNGEKKPYQSIQYDSNFLSNDIKEFLEARSWEKKSVFTIIGDVTKQSKPFPYPSMQSEEKPQMPMEQNLFESVPF